MSSKFVFMGLNTSDKAVVPDRAQNPLEGNAEQVRSP